MSRTAVALGIAVYVCAINAQAQTWLGNWEDYALAQLTPATLDNLAPLRSGPPSVFALDQAQAETTRISVRWLDQRMATAATTPLSWVASRSSGEVSARSGAQLQFPNGVRLDLYVLEVEQRYLRAGVGESRHDVASDPLAPRLSDMDELSGQGIEASLVWPAFDRLSLAVGARSAVDVDLLGNVRGVYREPASADLPAAASATLLWSPHRNISLGVGVEQQRYSTITAFASRALPNRLLALLGDSSSPDFAWRDLRSYRADLRFDLDTGMQWRLSWVEGVQPLPTSSQLERALQEGYAQRAYEIGLRQPLNSRVDVYLSGQFVDGPLYLGPGLYSADETTGGLGEARIGFDIRL